MNKENKKKSLSRRDILKAGTLGLAAAVAFPLLTSGPAFAATGGGKRILTVFHSLSGNTRSLAEVIHGRLGGDMAEILPATPYSSDYDTSTKEARYQLVTGKRPANQPLGVNPASYDIICVGSPLWWGTLSIPVITFLTSSDLAGKTVVPFNTNGGGARNKTFEDIAMICSTSTVLDGFKVEGGKAAQSDADVASWLRAIGVAG